MKIYLAADHRGHALTETLRQHLADHGSGVVIVEDLTPAPTPDDDYPQAAYVLVARLRSAAAAAEDARGILACGSGAGIAVAANRVLGMRAALGFSPEQIAAARHDDNVNILVLATDFTTAPAAQAIADAFITTPHEPNERYERRIQELDNPPRP